MNLRETPVCELARDRAKSRLKRLDYNPVQPTPPARPDFNAEARVQAVIVKWVRAFAPDVLIFSIPLGGLIRSKSEAARLKWLGAVSGSPDLCIVAPVARVNFIECKSATGRLSAEQIAVHDRLIALGTPVAIARSVDDVRRAFACWGIDVTEPAS